MTDYVMADPLAIPSEAPAAAQPNIVDSLHAQYPGLKKYGIEFQDSIGKSTDHRGGDISGRMLEFYPPGESYSPNPKKPVIEQFSGEMNPKDALGEIFSHYLPSVDKDFKAGRDKFIQGIDNTQKRMLMGDYQDQVKSGVFGKKPPSFDAWINEQGGDAFFRGYIADQYPKDFYRKDQVDLFDGLMKRLQQ